MKWFNDYSESKNQVRQKGLNYVTQIVDNNGCNFQPTDQENDIGIDGTIELFKEGYPTCQFIYSQIKTGKSFFDKNSQMCMIPIEKHREYWEHLPCPIIGIVCIVDETDTVIDAFWVNIQAYLKQHPNDTQIKFKATNENRLDNIAFSIGFQICLFRRFPIIPKSELYDFIKRHVYSDYCYKALGRYYAGEIDTWDFLFDAYVRNDALLEKSWFYDALTYAFSHPDHFYTKGLFDFSEESKLFVERKVAEFDIKDIVMMLSLIGDDGIQRGALGQSIEILISKVKCHQEKLLRIIVDPSQDEDIRLYANYILAYHDEKFYLCHMNQIEEVDADVAHTIAAYIAEYGSIDFYS